MFRLILLISFPLLSVSFLPPARRSDVKRCYASEPGTRKRALSNDYLENDLLSIRTSPDNPPRLCSVQPDRTVCPLCQRADDVETDLFADPREFDKSVWQDVTDDQITGTYGEGFYGQRPVPSLGGGPGYGAQAGKRSVMKSSLLFCSPIQELHHESRASFNSFVNPIRCLTHFSSVSY